MAESLHISQNAYSLIESGKTRLVDEERIKIIAEKLKVNPIELGLFDGIGLPQDINNHSEEAYINLIETSNLDPKEIVRIVLRQVFIKDKRIEQLVFQNG